MNMNVIILGSTPNFEFYTLFFDFLFSNNRTEHYQFMVLNESDAIYFFFF